MRVRPLRFLDLILLAVITPAALAAGVPAAGYGVGVGTWLVLRALGAAVEHQADALRAHGRPMAGLSRELAIRLTYRLMRALALGAASVLVVDELGRRDGLTTILVLTLACTVQMIVGGFAQVASRHPGPRAPDGVGRVRTYAPAAEAPVAGPGQVPPSAARNA